MNPTVTANPAEQNKIEILPDDILLSDADDILEEYREDYERLAK